MNDCTAGFYAKSVLIGRVFTSSVIYFYEQKVFGGALIWQLKQYRKSVFVPFFFVQKERVQLWWEGNVLHVRG